MGGQQTGLLVSYQIHDTKTGQLIRKIKPRPARSFLVNHMKHLQCALDDLAVSMTDTADVSVSVDTPVTAVVFWYNANAAAASALSGIVVGTGTTAVVPTQTKLVTPIAEGAGAGQMNYGICTIGVVAAGPTECTLDVTRSIANNSGASITVQEVGVAVRSENAGSAFLVIRDTTGALAVGAGQTLTVIYTYRTVL